MSARYYAYRSTRYRYRKGSVPPGAAAAVAAVVLLGAAGGAAHHGHKAIPAVTDDAASGAAATAIAYARHQLGCPYIWGGNGPCSAGYDCSGLVTAAYASAGIRIPRTSQAEWASLPHIAASQIRPGDLVFFPGSDGTWAAPGHVAMVISATRMLQAYAQGVPIEISPLSGAGAGGIVGFARPGGA